MNALRLVVPLALLALVTGCGKEEEPNALQVNLPVDLSRLANSTLLDRNLRSETARAALAKNGFVVVAWRGMDLFEYAYANIEHRKVPIVVTADSVLHLYHVLFDNALMKVEQRFFIADLKTLCDGVLQKAWARLQDEGRAQLLVEADRATLAFLSVARQLLDPEWQPAQEVADVVAKEIALINGHAGLAESPLFGYAEDYTQYIPRGHYTQAEELKRYFQAMMWLGRMSLLLNEGLVDEVAADRMTIQALLVSSDITRDEQLSQLWHRIYTVTSFFVGAADDLTILDYAEILDAPWFPASEEEMATKSFLDKARASLAEKAGPRIYGGTGAKRTWLNIDAEVRKTLAETMGLRVMGQRFVPDSYMMSRLVGLLYEGRGKPFTMEPSELGPIRAFPRGLDVMHLLGSARAQEILTSAGDTEYKDYSLRIQELRSFLDKVTQEQWHQNLYWSWLAALRTTLAPYGGRYPSFMRTEAYTDKALHTALASWAQLRHDTILYVKQSYTMEPEEEGGGGGSYEPPPEPPGYVEPVPDLYAELIALNKLSSSGLEKLGVLEDDLRERFTETGSILERLLALSLKELEAKELTNSDRRFIRRFGWRLSDAIGDLTDDSKRTTLVADVHTDLNSRKVLEEGTGEIALMWVVWKTPGGKLIAGAGPVLSQHEFKVPMQNRLTDEQWREYLKRQPPRLPSWTNSFRPSN